MITLPSEIPDTAACRSADDALMCGRISYTLTDHESGAEIREFPNKGIFWDPVVHQLILEP